ncbi:hypothetical protein A2767_05800 [Candidatus Roizmanbacteria bacterium RIFCSPHIGHO2_01_FULL_35_10]|uniref:Methyltransferase type 11 domain-containing protein n=1 Tax=Candidatus Roizmanbacteria bacterium RIFCSPLOWO2_01_FULL_35_13 TaxID=1802055 RepID=A0A1F7I750_9BACT|nr:MAG: hypothetical protein A2767_05800 [Candidatus Roizmanbacteria bacterium RIFCSPHIGHO2_01_FULL_35_10]OGK39102.1 MAG: hypothetical protein A3A74_05760 [Candidatus Roizmanbacteria bacterium RIFCSPLOWO2_01_FULL_35_13]
METKIKCGICDEKLFKVIYKSKISDYKDSNYLISDSDYGKHPQIVRCMNCSLIYVNPREKRSNLEKHYLNLNDPDYQAESENRALSFKKILKKLENYKADKGTILDIGCSTGIFLHEAEKLGWKTYGTDLSEWSINFAKNVYHLKNVFQGTLEKQKFKSNFFDCIVILDVIEHVTDPGKLLKEANRLLKKDGILCLVTPDIGSPTAKIMKESWWHIRPPHLFYFTSHSIKKLLEKNNFSILKKNRYTWYFSIDYLWKRVKKIKNPVFNFLNLLLEKTFINMVKKWVVPVNLFDSMEVYASKKNE